MNDFNRKEQEKHYQSIIGLGDDQWDSIDIAKELTDRDETIHELQALVDELAERIRETCQLVHPWVVKEHILSDVLSDVRTSALSALAKCQAFKERGK